jgi:hypothetical protein
MSTCKIIHELVSSDPTHNLESFREIFNILGEGELDKAYE